MTQSVDLFSTVKDLLKDNCPNTAISFEHTVRPTDNIIVDTNRFLRTKLRALDVDTRRERLVLDDNTHPSIWVSEIESVVGNGFLA